MITNADGSAQKQKTQADQCLANGAKVVILVSLDKGSSIAIEAAAKSRDAKVIEYDRQVIGGIASIYISFDGKAVGVLQGKGVVAGLKKHGMYRRSRSSPSCTAARPITTRSCSRAATSRS